MIFLTFQCQGHLGRAIKCKRYADDHVLPKVIEKYKRGLNFLWAVKYMICKYMICKCTNGTYCIASISVLLRIVT